MLQKFENIIKYLIGADADENSIPTINITEQFNPDKKDDPSIAKNLNAAFLIALSGKSNPSYNRALRYLDYFLAQSPWQKTVRFYNAGLELIRSEICDRCQTDSSFQEKLNQLHTWISISENRKNRLQTVEKIRQLFFPEGVSLSRSQHRQEKINLLRECRKIKITRSNPSPITNPAHEILFTSNILVTTPLASKNIDNLPINVSIKQRLAQVIQEERLYWYDHPIPIGISPKQNEAVYGLTGLEEMLKFEIGRANVAENTKLNCVLSVSVTHKGLQTIVKEYIEDELRKATEINHLNVYLFTEADARKLIEEILIPVAKKIDSREEHRLLYEIFGVDGEYGRHYSFLKAISAFWQVFIDPKIRATFKIDLDQVFPQEALVEQSGASAFEHFKTPLWGAEGIDIQGNKVELGMIAGALVNKEDIEHSLFYPDVSFPSDNFEADELIFLSQLPQALSTNAEMMTRYSGESLDGINQVIHRIHVTGGTNGILVDALRKYKPFTPTFIGRAEDQAYLLSVLFDGSKYLRYLHKDGLIMRHDKKAFAEEALKASALSKIIGDYVRILLFSYYVEALPWSLEDIKNAIDPFTGCFVTKMPITVVYLRFAFKLASFFVENRKEQNQQGIEFLDIGSKRLYETIQELTKKPNPLIEQFRKEKRGWSLYYKILEVVEEHLKQNDRFALELKKKAKSLVKSCQINLEKS